MKALTRCIFALALFAAPVSAFAQQDYKAVSVYRIVKLRILPGKTKDFYKTLEMAAKVWEAEKTAGVILDYQIFHSTGYEGVDRYDVMYSVHLKNMAAIDTFADQSDPIIAKVYGTREKAAEWAKLRAEAAEVVSSELVRDIQLTPAM